MGLLGPRVAQFLLYIPLIRVYTIFVDIDAENLTIIGFCQELVSKIFLVDKILHSSIIKYLSSQSQLSALTGSDAFCFS